MHMLKNQTATIVCLGNGQMEADQMCQKLAQEYGVIYQGILDNSTQISNGLYHTSIYDIELPKLIDKLVEVTDVVVIMLDQDETFYNNHHEYSATLQIAQELESIYNIKYINESMRNTFISELKKNKSLCILPFVGVFIKDSSYSACCLMTHPVTQQLTNYKTDSGFNTIRQKMLLGETVLGCETCYYTETHGGTSHRITLSTEWGNRLKIKSLDDLVNRTEIVKYEIDVGNLCNAMCRSCHPEHSSLIAKEYKKIGWQTNPTMRKENNFKLINLEQAEQVYLNGGEPTISKDFYNFLRRCIQHGRTDLEIIVNTNAKVLKPEFIELAKNFTNLKFEVSIDGFGDSFTYIRWPIKWHDFCENVKKMNYLAHGNISFNVVSSMYNISSMYDIFYWIETNYPKQIIHVQELIDPKILSPLNHPNKSKNLENLEKIKTLNYYKKDQVFAKRIDRLQYKIENSFVDDELLLSFFKYTDALDQSRGVSLSQCDEYLASYQSTIK